MKSFLLSCIWFPLITIVGKILHLRRECSGSQFNYFFFFWDIEMLMDELEKRENKLIDRPLNAVLKRIIKVL